MQLERVHRRVCDSREAEEEGGRQEEGTREEEGARGKETSSRGHQLKPLDVPALLFPCLYPLVPHVIYCCDKCQIDSFPKTLG